MSKPSDYTLEEWIMAEQQAVVREETAARERDAALAECERLRARLAEVERERDEAGFARDAYLETVGTTMAERYAALAECERLRARVEALSTMLQQLCSEAEWTRAPQTLATIDAARAVLAKTGGAK